MSNPTIAAAVALYFCIIGQAAAAAEVALPVCRESGETRIKVPMWSGKFTKTSTPPLPSVKNFQVIYIDLFFDNFNNSNFVCSLEGPEKIYTLTAEQYVENIDGAEIDSGGVEVNVQVPYTYSANGICFISGFFISRPAPGAHQGWVSYSFRSVDAFEVIKSNQFCLEELRGRSAK